MNRHLARLAAGASVLAGGVALAAAPDPSAFIALSASVLRIEGTRPDGGIAFGSAVTVGQELVITNCHVTRAAKRLSVVRGGARWTAGAVLSRHQRDLCLLRVPGLQSPPVPLGQAADLALGQPVVALGYTGGVGLQNSVGAVQDLHRYEGAYVIRSSNWFSSGASGGGLFDEGGRLVGVLTFRLRGGEAHYFAVPAEWVRELVAQSGGAGPANQAAAADDPSLRAFWESAVPPRFLRAAQLRRDGRWAELESMASAWLREDAGDGEPWVLLGDALEHQGRAAEARRALECAWRVQPARRRAMAAGARGAAASGPAAANRFDCNVDRS